MNRATMEGLSIFSLVVLTVTTYMNQDGQRANIDFLVCARSSAVCRATQTFPRLPLRPSEEDE